MLFLFKNLGKLTIKILEILHVAVFKLLFQFFKLFFDDLAFLYLIQFNLFKFTSKLLLIENHFDLKLSYLFYLLFNFVLFLFQLLFCFLNDRVIDDRRLNWLLFIELNELTNCFPSKFLLKTLRV